MRVFNKHYKNGRVNNPRSKKDLQRCIANGFERLYVENPRAYSRTYKKAFGRAPDLKENPYESAFRMIEDLHTDEMKRIKELLDAGFNRREAISEVDRDPDFKRRRQEIKKKEEYEKRLYTPVDKRPYMTRRYKKSAEVSLTDYGHRIEKAGKKWVWEVFGSDGTVLIQGSSGDRGTAGRTVKRAEKAIGSLMSESPTTASKKWLAANKDKLTTAFQSVVEYVEKLPPGEYGKEIRGMIKRGELQGYKDDPMGREALGFEEVIRGKGYELYLRKGRKGFFVKAIDSDGRETVEFGPYAKKKRGDPDPYEIAVKKGHMEAGRIKGIVRGVTVAHKGNPASINKLRREARMELAKRNPADAKTFLRKVRRVVSGTPVEKTPAREGMIQEVSALGAIPKDPTESFRLGFYNGIVSGMDTCGVQNYFERRKIRRRIDEMILDAQRKTRIELTRPIREGEERGDVPTAW